jgi:hypothetical protein
MHALRRNVLICCCASIAGGAIGAGSLPALSATVDRGGCEPPFPAIWKPSETWAWGEICNGRTADFNKRDAARSLNPSLKEGWTPDREISLSFLRTVLLLEPYRSVGLSGGAYFRGVWIKEPLVLNNVKVNTLLGFEDSRIEKGVDLSGVKSDFAIYFDDSWINGNFKINSSIIGPLTIPNLTVRGDVELTGTHINGYWWGAGADVSGKVDAGSMTISGDANLRDVKFTGTTNFQNSSILNNLDISGGTFSILDMTNAKVVGEMFLGRYEPDQNTVISAHYKQNKDASLILANVNANSWGAGKDGWPLINIAGFNYSYFEIFDLGQPSEIGEWGISTLLKNDQSGSLQPYEQYATSLATRGFASQADDVRFAERERERSRSVGLHWLLLIMSRWLIGYGYGNGYFNALGWMALMVIIARIMIWVTNENHLRETKLDVLYCIDVFVPFLQLRGGTSEIKTESNILFWYLIFHRISGYILGSFVLAGIAGWTK